MTAFSSDLQERFDALANDPALTDQRHPNFAATRQEWEQLRQLRAAITSPAYSNPQHPEHEVTKTQVRRFFEAEYGNVSHTRRVNPIVTDSGTGKPGTPFPKGGMR